MNSDAKDDSGSTGKPRALCQAAGFLTAQGSFFFVEKIFKGLFVKNRDHRQITRLFVKNRYHRKINRRFCLYDGHAVSLWRKSIRDVVADEP